jgi:hypothetical protein
MTKETWPNESDSVLQTAWNRRAELQNQSNALYSEGYELRIKGGEFVAQGDLLYIQGDQLYAEGDAVWVNAVIETHGPKTLISWKSNAECELMFPSEGEE